MVLVQEGSSMRKFVILFAVLFLAAFILLPSTSNGKYKVSKPLVADGWPLPLPPPLSSSRVNTLVADGWPLPLPPPPTGSGFYAASSSETLVADGWPLPLPPPPSGSYLNDLLA